VRIFSAAYGLALLAAFTCGCSSTVSSSTSIQSSSNLVGKYVREEAKNEYIELKPGNLIDIQVKHFKSGGAYDIVQESGKYSVIGNEMTVRIEASEMIGKLTIDGSKIIDKDSKNVYQKQ
jgi:hypothetical protein